MSLHKLQQSPWVDARSAPTQKGWIMCVKTFTWKSKMKTKAEGHIYLDKSVMGYMKVIQPCILKENGSGTQRPRFTNKKPGASPNNNSHVWSVLAQQVTFSVTTDPTATHKKHVLNMCLECDMSDLKQSPLFGETNCGTTAPRASSLYTVLCVAKSPYRLPQHPKFYWSKDI